MKEKQRKIKFAFSLFEVLVTAGIIAIFIAACSNVFTKKHVKQVAIPDHGRYECYYKKVSGTYKLYSNVCTENGACTESLETEANGCVFNAPKAANYLSINATGPGGAGGAVHGGTAGGYITAFLSNTKHPLALHPGKPGTENPTTIVNNDNHETVLTAKAGHKTFAAGHFNIVSCEFVQTSFSVVNYVAQCKVNKNELTVTLNFPKEDNPHSFNENNLIKGDVYKFSEFNDTVTGADDQAKLNGMILYPVDYAYKVKDGIEFGSHILGDSIDYKNTPTDYSDDYTITANDFLKSAKYPTGSGDMHDDGYGTIRLNIDDNVKPGSTDAKRQESAMTLYIKSLGSGAVSGLGELVNSASTPSPGDGGGKGEGASTGAVMIAW